MAEVSVNIGIDSERIPPTEPDTSSAKSGNSGHKELQKANTCGPESGDSGHKELQEENGGGAENNGNQTPIEQIENTTPSLVIPTDDGTQFLLSQELFVFRWALRILSLWCPTTACFAERLFYPALVNLLLLYIILFDFYMLATGGWRSLDIYVYLAIDGGMYSSHLFGLFYFRSRDLETNLLHEI